MRLPSAERAEAEVSPLSKVAAAASAPTPTGTAAAAIGTLDALILTLRGGDLAAAASCFARDACLRTPDATTIHGRPGIRDTLAQLIAMESEIDAELDSIVLGGGTVLARGRWRTRSREPSGRRLEHVSRLTVILRAVEGDWKIVVALPWE